jgi:hypothetical protein
MCYECALSSPLFNYDLPDISPNNWEEDLGWVLGTEGAGRILALIADDPDFAFLCKGCGRSLAPWSSKDDVYEETYHLEEHYGIPLETPGKRVPSAKLRKQIFKLYDHACFGCGARTNLHLDHILPVSRGGDAAFRNLQPLCERCGQAKGDGLPEDIEVHSDIYFGPYPSDGFPGLFW